MAIKNPAFTDPALTLDPSILMDNALTNKQLVEVVQQLAGAVRTLKGTIEPEIVNVLDGDVVVSRYTSVITGEGGGIDEINTITPKIFISTLGSGDIIQNGGYIEIYSSLENTITVKNSVGMNGVQTLNGQDRTLSKETPLTLFRKDNYWIESKTTSLGDIIKEGIVGYLGEFRYFNRRTPFDGWVVCNGSVISEADTKYPWAWSQFLLPENDLLTTSESDWQSRIHADGMGGAAFFVQDIPAKTLRLPDTRGDYIAGAGWKSKKVGDSDDDAMRNIKGGWTGYTAVKTAPYLGILVTNGGTNKTRWTTIADSNAELGYSDSIFDASRVTNTDTRNHPNTIYQLPCVYIGK